MNTEFEKAYKTWMDNQISRRKGEAKRRLVEGHSHAEKWCVEKIWWEAFGNLDGLYAEYEVRDFKDGVRYIDLVFIRGPLRIAIEIDGYGPHSRDISRSQFADQLMRQNHLVIDGWIVIRFSYDDLKERPRMCQQILQQLLGKWYSRSSNGGHHLTLQERELVRLVWGAGVVSPSHICAGLQVGQQKARQLLHHLLQRGILTPAAKGRLRIRKYALREGVTPEMLGL